jgi:immune inhibitor A
MNGFKITNGTEATNKPHYYIAEFRQYRTYDTTLQVGPYNFGDAARPDWVYHYPYQDGLLITYWDTDQSNDNTSSHPGEGRSLPIDAHPDPLIRTGTWPGGSTFASPWSATVQTFDATFGLKPTDPLNIPFYGTSSGQRIQFQFTSPSLPAVPVFDDANSYWNPITQYNSVIVPHTGTSVRIVNYSAQGSFMQVQVIPGNR